MPKNRKDTDKKHAQEEGLNRRDFFKAGAAASVAAGAMALSPTQAAAAAGDASRGAADIEWDYEVDVVIAGGGCAGLTAAIRARDLGASVLVVDQNFDLGGRMLHSGAWLSLGGGDPIQIRDMEGRGDDEGFITVPPPVAPEALDDNIDLLFQDITDWSIVDTKAQSPYRYNQRDLMRAWAENCGPTRQFLMDNYVRFSRITGTHGGGGLSRARAPWAFLMLGDRTDMRAGTITEEDAGIVDAERTSPFAPVKMGRANNNVGPGAVQNGVALARPLEFSAREKGVQFMLFRHFDEIIREEPTAGRVLGIKASYTPRHDPDSGELLRSWWQEGNIDERRQTIHIKARKGVVLASGGFAGNPEVRSMFYPAFQEPAFVTSGYGLQGPHGQDGSALVAGMKVGANLAGMQQNLSYSTTFHIASRLGTRDAYTAMFPGHPGFKFRKSTGLSIGGSGFQELIAVNQVGKRFFNETRLASRPAGNNWPAGPNRGQPRSNLDHVPNDWRNCSAEWIKQMYNYDHGLDAALAMNEGSQPPNYHSGPIWAIFDQAAADRTGWNLRFPFISDEDGYSFRADTIQELAGKVFARHPFQRVPLRHLTATIDTWNSYVDAGEDPEFDRHVDGPMYAILEPPFYALSIVAVWHDSYGGLRVNPQQQVLDVKGEVIRGLYAGGEAVGGFNKHGLGKGHVHGYVAGTYVARDPS